MTTKPSSDVAIVGAGTIGVRQMRNARRTRRAAKDAERRLALDAAKARVK